MTEEVLTPRQIHVVEIVIFYFSPTDSNTFIRRMREKGHYGGGGGGGYFLLIINGTFFLSFFK